MSSSCIVLVNYILMICKNRVYVVLEKAACLSAPYTKLVLKYPVEDITVGFLIKWQVCQGRGKSDSVRNLCNNKILIVPVLEYLPESLLMN